jgi:WD40 repeat protein/serine/threonine protein kinase
MSCETPCPEPERLKQLLDSSLTDTDQARVVGHLDSCTGCQRSLEELAAGDSSWPEAVRHLDGDAPPATSAFWPALAQLEDGGAATRAMPPPAPGQGLDGSDNPLSLDFLQPAESPESLGRLGHFDILEVIGRGGMGIVLKAYDACLERPVAVKVLDPKLANNEVARQRFCRESRAAAQVTHENVVTVLQVEREESTDLPFLVMQLVTGESLQQRLDRVGALELKEVLRIGLKAARGLAAAHAQGLIHRDIKPANILLEAHGGQVRLTDFGLARAAEDVKLTQTGFVAGTPLYMAPEQAKGEAVDHRADLFSLGSVLYAMATGKPPFEGSTPFVILKGLTEQQPRPIREVNPDIPDWLVAIIDRLHAKNPADRFQSAAEVSELLAQRLAQVQYSTEVQVPVADNCGRKRLWTLAVAVPLSVLGWLLVAEWSGLTRLTPGMRPPPPKPEVAASKADASPEPRATVNAGAGPIWSLAFSPDGRTLALALATGKVKLWDLEGGRFKTTINAHEGTVWSVAFAPDGKTLATGSSDGTAKIWDLKTGKEHLVLDHDREAVRCLAFARDGKRLAVGTRNGLVYVWDLIRAKRIAKAEGHRGEVYSVSFSPDGATVASASGDETVKLWDAATGQERLALEGHRSGVYAVAFDPDNVRLASGGWDHTVRLWDARSGDPLGVWKGHAEDVWSVAFSPDGRRLASAGEDRTVKLWDVAAGRELVTLKEHTGSLYAVTFAPDGKTLASGGRDGLVRLWDVAAIPTAGQK